MKSLLLIAFLSLPGLAEEPVLKPEANKRIQKNLEVLSENIDRARKNLAAATHNIDTLTAEIGALEKLEKEHEALRTKYKDIDKSGADADKTKALIKGIDDSLGQIAIQKVPLERQLQSWKERVTVYDAKLSEFEKKKEELEAPPQSLNDSQN